MEVAIRECPACQAVVMGDESVCNACGKELPKDTAPAQAHDRRMTAPVESACPKCGATVPRGVLRCRDCGSYMDPEVEATMLAKQLSRGGYAAPAGYGGLVAGGAAFGSSPFSRASQAAASSFAEVADDADFDLVGGSDSPDQYMDDSGSQGAGTAVGDEDDFEMGTGAGVEGYAVSAPAGAPPPVGDLPALSEPPAGAPRTRQTPAAEHTAVTGLPSVEALRAAAGAGPDVAHSVETGGDVLFDAALEEERDTQNRMKGGKRRVRRSATTTLGPDRFLVFCPNGHRIQVHTKHRGRTGRCPNCRTLFFVPLPDVDQTAGEGGGAVEGAAAPGEAGAAPAAGYTRWIADVRLHRLNPAKLKLKAGSLEAEYEPVDLSPGAEHFLVAVLFTGGGPFRAMQEPKKKAAARQAMLEHFRTGMPLADIPVPKHFALTPDQLQQLKIAQPTVPGEESLFADVPVFGEGRIAVRVPALDGAGERAYLSFTLSQFREFSAVLGEAFGLIEFGAGTSIPMADSLQEGTCHYSETVLHSLPVEQLPYYKADPAFKLVVLGRKCQKCGLVVGEDSRKKEKIGGSSDASVAKAKCPKCKQKFGDITLYGVPQG